MRKNAREIVNIVLLSLVFFILGFTFVIPVFTRLFNEDADFTVCATDTSGPNSPTQHGMVYDTWNAVEVEEVYEQDDSTISTSSNPASDEQDYYSFGFSSISGVIEGIEVEMDCYYIAQQNQFYNVELSGDGGVSWTASGNTISGMGDSDTDTYYSCGGSADLWGKSWSASNFTDENFSVYFDMDVNRATGEVDHIRVTVYYTPFSINFAGNLSDDGGPYWRPPTEDKQLSGIFSDGYYTNDSRQKEDWMYINVTAPGATQVNLNWLNGTQWINGTQFDDRGSDYWDINTSNEGATLGVLSCGNDYSFDVNVTGGSCEGIYEWNKTGIGGGYTRRYVQLGCDDTVNVSYQPYYLLNYTSETGSPPTYGDSDRTKGDRMHHDQGIDGTINDTGYLSNIETLTDTMHLRWCSGFTGYWFEDSVCVQDDTIENVYIHVWASSDDNDVTFRIAKSRIVPLWPESGDDTGENRSTITWENGATPSDNYFLRTGLFDTADKTIGDNDVFEYSVLFGETLNNPSIICNQSIQSFVLFNVPDNATLNASYPDSDSDGLGDWYELYRSYTNPFDTDTDSDGVSDFFENMTGSDPNNWSDTVDISYQLESGFSFSGNNVSKLYNDGGFSFSGNNVISWSLESGFSFSGNNVISWSLESGFSFSGNNVSVQYLNKSFSFSGDNSSSQYLEAGFSFQGGNGLTRQLESGFSFSGGNVSKQYLESGFSFSGDNNISWTKSLGFSFSGNNVTVIKSSGGFSFSGNNLSHWYSNRSFSFAGGNSLSSQLESGFSFSGNNLSKLSLSSGFSFSGNNLSLLYLSLGFSFSGNNLSVWYNNRSFSFSGGHVLGSGTLESSFSFSGNNVSKQYETFSFSFSGNNISHLYLNRSFSFTGGNSISNQLESGFSFSGNNVSHWYNNRSFSFSGNNISHQYFNKSFSFSGNNLSVWHLNRSFSFSGGHAYTISLNKSFSFSGNNLSVRYLNKSFSFSGNNISSWYLNRSFSFSGGHTLGSGTLESGFSFGGNNVSKLYNHSGFSFSGNNLSRQYENFSFSFSGNNISHWCNNRSFSFKGDSTATYVQSRGFSFSGDNVSVQYLNKSFSFSGNNVSKIYFNHSFSFSGNNISHLFLNRSFSFSGGNALGFNRDRGFSFSGNNVSIWYSNRSFSFTGGNISYQSLSLGFSFSGDNVSMQYENFSFSFKGGNVTVFTLQAPFSFSFAGGNHTLYITNRSFSFSAGNLSLGIIVNDPEPVNNGNVYDSQPVVCFNLTSLGGFTMNYTIYIGNSTVNTTYELTNNSGVGNGTYCYNNYTNATLYNTYYYWRVYAEDDHGYTANETFRFLLTVAYSGYIISSDDSINGILALGAGSLLFFFIGMFIWRRKRKNGNDNGYRY